MARDKTFVVNDDVVRDMLNSAPAQQACLDEAELIAAQAGLISASSTAIYTANVQAGKKRAQARAVPGNEEAWWDTLRDNTLLKAAGGA